MVWGAFHKSGALDLCFTSSRMKSVDYVKVLEDRLLPFLEENGERPFIYMQDNASVHRSRETHRFFNAHSVNVLDWPACSPDLNPIENIWRILARAVYAKNKKFDNVKDLKTEILKQWSLLDKSLLINLINSMPKRLFEVAKAQGGAINY